ncbi:hypothetical protein ABIF66_009649 [Bradyrhizobium japonicum]
MSARQLTPQKCGVATVLMPVWPLKIAPVLVGEIIESRADREGDHDGVDALGAHRQRAAKRAEQGRERERHRDREPPRPTQADIGVAADAEHRDHIGGEACDGELHQADHAAVAGEEHQAQRHDAEDQRGRKDLDQEEAVGDQRHDQENGRDDPGCRIVDLRPSAQGGALRRCGGTNGDAGVVGERHLSASPTGLAAGLPVPAP